MTDIDKNIPIPPRRVSLIKEYAIKDLEVGDSKLIPIDKRPHVASALSQYKKRSGREFTTKVEGKDNFRVWRIK
jgi:hypothetical protein